MEQAIVSEQPISLAYENHTAVYEHFRHLQPDTKALRLMHLLAGRIYRPRIQFEEGVEDAMREDEENGVQYIFAANHSRLDDQFPYASMMHRKQVFHRFIGNTVILSKIEHFKRPRIRSIIEKWGAIPVYRKEDVENNNDVDPLEVAEELQNTVVGKVVEDDMSLFLFPEGTRKRKDQHKLGQVKKGIGRFACDAYEAGADISILPMAHYWGDSDNKRWVRRWLRPDIYVSMPIRMQGEAEDNAPSSVMAPVRQQMAHSLDMAKQASDKRKPTLRLSAVRLAKRLKLTS